MGSTVMVTGANGHLGFNLAKALRERGHQVRCSVRDAHDEAKTAHLRKAGLSDLVSLDVTDGRQFVEVSAGIDTLYHAAATYKYWTPDETSVRQMIRDSVEGAANAVRAASASKIRKLVLTSSIVTLPFANSPHHRVDETQWRADLRVPYFRAKTEAEKIAWDLSRQLGVDMVAILPAAIIGPGFQRHTTSTEVIENMMRGAFRTGVPRSNFPAVDIRDVVDGHILAADRGGSGRYIICNDDVVTFKEMIAIMHAIDVRVPKSWTTLPDAMLAFGPFFDWLNAKTLGTHRLFSGEFVRAVKGQWWVYSNARAKRELGWQQRVSLQQSLADTMTAIRQFGASKNRAAAG